MPDAVGVLLGHCADGLPFLLEAYQLVGGLLPVCGVFEGLGLLAESGLPGEVGGQLLFHLAVVLGLEGEELVAYRTEAREKLVVGLSRREAEFLPVFLRGENLLGHLVPGGVSLERGEVEGFHAFAYLGLGLLVLEFAGFAFLEESLVFLVDEGGSILEAGPDFLAYLLSNGACLTPFVVEVLQPLECQDDVFLLVELLGLLAEEGLQLEVLAEVIVAEVFVDFQLVVELLHGSLVILPQLCGLCGRYFADFLELGLYLLDARESAVDIVGVGRYGV